MTSAQNDNLDFRPKIAILLATYNGEPWLNDQLDSIFAQRDCRVHIFANDDGSSDATLDILAANAGVANLSTTFYRNGGAGQNFLYLLRETDLNSFDYVAFSDQDDLWVPNKLSRAVKMLIENSADAYSSNVTAFWSDGDRRLIVKSQPQRKFDFMFESAGPGCTFVLSANTAAKLQSFLRDTTDDKIFKVALHDWFIYAWVRGTGQKWFIDDFSSLDYRQHDRNVLGASRNKSALIKRWKMVADGWYFSQAQLNVNLIGFESAPANFLRFGGLNNMLVSLLSLTELRRRRSEAIFVGIVFLYEFFVGLRTKRR